jgi:hypothetical protein
VIGGAETFRDLSEIEALRQELNGKAHVGDLTSRSPVMQKLFAFLPAIATSPSTVFILGETGTGKELVAHTLHDLSPRSRGPFVAVNCGALPDTQLESELFGYKAGAFTGAAKDKPGRFALAEGGTIFLDEIGDITPALQDRLLRVLQEKSYEPLGAVRSETTNARVIVATNRDLTELVKKNLFREDLYYRINIVRIELPALRRRKEDIPLLVDRFIDRLMKISQRRGDLMKTAFPYWRHRIAPVFDTARQILVVSSDTGMTTGTTRVTLADGHPTVKLLRLVELQVDSLVCGALSSQVCQMAAFYGITVVPFIAGDLDAIVRLWVAGKLAGDANAMPGCRRRWGDDRETLLVGTSHLRISRHTTTRKTAPEMHGTADIQPARRQPGGGRWGRRSMLQAAGVPGRLRFGGYGVPQAQSGPEQERSILKHQAETLKADLEIITRRLQALEPEADDQ